MILRHYRILASSHRPPLTHAGRFWVAYIAGVAVLVAWVLA